MVDKMKKNISFILFFTIIFYSFSQNIEVMKDSLLKEIQTLQCKNDSFYADGLFPSQRNKKEDNNIFFSVFITYTLQSIREEFNEHQKVIIDSICNKVKQNYPNYKSRKGDITYNFWQIRPKEMPMPNNKILSKWNRLLLADDLDDTSLIYLTLNNPQNDSLLKEKIAFFTHDSTKKIKSADKKYRNYKAYYTWFGKKMKQDFDICVLSNILLFVFEKDLPVNKYDIESMNLIKEMIMNNDHFNEPHLISSWYKKNAIILYKLSRILSKEKHEILNSLIPKAIDDLKKQLVLSENKMEKILILSSLARLNQSMPFFKEFKNVSTDFEDFIFFDLNYFFAQPIGVKKVIGNHNFGGYKCEAYYQTLLLEYLCLYKKKLSHLE